MARTAPTRRRFGLTPHAAIAALGAALLGLPAAATAPAAPEPNPIPTAWELDVVAGPLRVIRMPVPGEGIHAFYYMTFTVTNDTGQDLFFAPMFELATDQGEIILSGRGVPTAVTQEIIRRQRNPYLQDQISIIGPIQQGVENAKDGVAIWPVGETNISEINVYCMGFSGETRTLHVRDAETGETWQVVLYKTLMLRHRAPGDLFSLRETQGGRELPRYQTRWIMRRAEAIIEPRSDEPKPAAAAGNDTNTSAGA